MQYRQLGDTGLMVSVLGYGASPFGDIFGDTDDTQAYEAVALAMDAGINYFDVAPSYGPEGRAEERLGRALKGRRKDIVLATKAGKYDHGTVEHPVIEYDYSARRVFAEIEHSLKRLATDYIDVYQVHELCNADENMVLEQTLPAMLELKKKGKIRYIGITDNSLSRLKSIIEKSPVKIDTALSFCCYNLIDTRLKGYFGSLLTDKGVGLINASVLNLGLMAPNNKAVYSLRDDPKCKELRAAIQKAEAINTANGTTLASQAVRFSFCFQEPATTLMGMGRKSSVQRNLGLYDKEPDWELVRQIRELFQGVPNPFNLDVTE